MSASTDTSSQRAMHALYVDHHGWLHGWLRKKLGCADNAADLAHDTFLRVLQKREPQILREPRAYLTTIARGLVINLWQRQALERAYLEELSLLPESEAPSEESRLLIFEALLQIESLLRALPPAVRSAFLWSQLDGLGYAEIADRLGVSTRTVKRHMVVAFEQCLQALP